MSEIKLPFARRTSDGALVTPDEVSRGLACDCVCPGCGSAVQANQGTERIWHFAHAKKIDCVGAYEKSVHEVAKAMLRDKRLLLLPALTASVKAVDAFARVLRETETILSPRKVVLESCRTGQVLGDVAPDLVGFFRGRRLLLEVTVFHRLMPDKLDRLQRTGLPILEVDLGVFRTKQATREALMEALFEQADNWRWVWHPAQQEVSDRLASALNQRLEAVLAQWVEQEERAKAARDVQRIRGTTHFSAPIAYTASSEACWRAGFPPKERWAPAQIAFAERHGIAFERVQAVLGAITSRRELARATPQNLASAWSEQLGVSVSDITRYFVEGGYVL